MMLSIHIDGADIVQIAVIAFMAFVFWCVCKY